MYLKYWDVSQVVITIVIAEVEIEVVGVVFIVEVVKCSSSSSSSSSCCSSSSSSSSCSRM